MMTQQDQSPKDRKYRAVEQLLEDESLTDNLVDEAARVLLDWGAEQLTAASRPSEGFSQTELLRCASRLRRFLRRVNERVGEASPDQQAERVRMILSRIEQAEGAGRDNVGG